MLMYHFIWNDNTYAISKSTSFKSAFHWGLSECCLASQHSSRDNDDEGLAETGAVGGNEPAHAGLVDSKGFRILKNQVLDIQNMTSDVVTNILCNSILCNHGNYYLKLWIQLSFKRMKH